MSLSSRAMRVLLAFLLAVSGVQMIPDFAASEALAAPAPADVSYNSVEFVDRDNGWVAGNGGTILRTRNGGADWEVLGVGTTADFVSVSFADLDKGWALTRDARVWRTADGGDTWVLMPPAKYGSTDLVGGTFYYPEAHAIEVADGGRIFFSANKFAPGPHAAGNVGLLYRSDAVGTGWENRVLEAPDYRHPDDTEPLGESQFRGIEFVGESTGWVVGIDYYAAQTSPFRPKPIVYRTTLGGGLGTWDSQTLPAATGFESVNGVSFASATFGIAVGDNGYSVRTTNGGSTWTLYPTGTDRRLNDVFVLDANNAWAVGEAGTVRRTTDGGLTWTAGWVQSAMVSLRSVELVAGPLLGWLVGDSGRIRITADGQNWYAPASTYTLTYTAGTGGTISGTSPQTVDQGSDGSAVTAVPDEGYTFVGWSDGRTDNPRTDTSVTANKSVSATFAPKTAPPPSVPIAGDDRYLTAIEGSKYAFPGGAPAVVIATGENFADALGGAGLAGALDSPLLLTQKASLPKAVSDEITRLKATKAYILGGTGAVSAQVESALKAKLGKDNVIPIAGANRYDTAYKVAQETIAILGSSYTGSAFVATGANFPDALGASPVAAAKGMPVILADPTRSSVTLPSQVKRVWITGGVAAVPVSIETSLKKSLGNTNVTRLAGVNRNDTAARVAAYGVSIAMSWDGVGITTGTNFPDALAAGPVLGSKGAVMLLTEGASVPAPTSSALSANKAAITTVHFFGGKVVVPPSVRTTVLNLVK